MTATTIDEGRLLSAVMGSESTGFCVRCGAETDGVEPDAERVWCENCGRPSVYGCQVVPEGGAR